MLLVQFVTFLQTCLMLPVQFVTRSPNNKKILTNTYANSNDANEASAEKVIGRSRRER